MHGELELELKKHMTPLQQQGWDKSALRYEIVSNLDGARDALRAVSDTEPRANGFLWEKFMTKPLVHSSCLHYAECHMCFIAIAESHVLLTALDSRAAAAPM